MTMYPITNFKNPSHARAVGWMEKEEKKKKKNLVCIYIRDWKKKHASIDTMQLSLEKSKEGDKPPGIDLESRKGPDLVVCFCL